MYSQEPGRGNGGLTNGVAGVKQQKREPLKMSLVTLANGKGQK